MPTYLMLSQAHPEGFRTIKQHPGRIDAARQQIRQMGGELKAWYLLMGQYDGALLIEAPDDHTVAKISLWINSGGTGRVETYRAFTEEEDRAIVASLP